jgi:hypothetical protein
VICGICIDCSIARGVASGHFDWWRYGLARFTRLLPLFMTDPFLAMVVCSLGCRELSPFSDACYILHMPLLVHYSPGYLAVRKDHAFVPALQVFIGPALERFFMVWRSRVLSGETRA